MNFEIVIIGAGISGASFANKIVKFAKTLLLDAQDISQRPKSTNIFPFHNKSYIEESEWANEELFPTYHLKTNYMGSTINGIINSEEFGRPLGKVVYLEKLLNRSIQKFEEKGGIFKDKQKVIKINKYNDHLEIITNSGQTYSCKLLVFATGSRALDLQRSMGFDTPDEYVGIYCHFHGDEDKLNENLDVNYLFHINTKISRNGPLFINKGKERLSIGFLGDNQPIQELGLKLNNIINNYKKIQPFIEGLTRDSKAIVAKISKHPIKSFSRERMLVLGEAAGLVTPFFYEGILCGLVSAEIASYTTKSLIENNSDFNQLSLRQYDNEITRVFRNFFKNGKGSEYIFYSAGSNMQLIWDSYTKSIFKDKKLRRYIYEAYQIEDIEALTNYDTSRDRYAGERMLANLPFLSKITLLPFFLKSRSIL